MSRFAYPWFLILLALLPALVRRYVRAYRTGSGPLRFASTIALEGVHSPWTIRGRHFIFGMELLAIALTVLAMARPQLGIEEEEILTEGVDILIALDASGSMAAEDFAPRNRLFVAKLVASRFVQGLRQDRVGLVVFAGKAFTRCPLTVDYGVALNILNSVELGSIEDGTSIGNALAACLNRLRGSEAKSKVVILVTDGVNNRGEIQPLDAAEMARALAVKVYTIGIGSRGTARVPVRDPNYGTVYANIPVEIDEDSLTRIAEITGGLYYRATDKPSLERIFEEIGKLEKTQIQARTYTYHRERFWAFLAAALVLGLLAAVGGHTRFSKLP
ncbi:MAG: VWA domain-containing protein [Acidobacteriota bacterium]